MVTRRLRVTSHSARFGGPVAVDVYGNTYVLCFAGVREGYGTIPYLYSCAECGRKAEVLWVKSFPVPDDVCEACVELVQ